MFDLDRFKPINDRYGHGVGDKVLAGIGRRLDNALKPGEIAARLGGDEFVVAVPIQCDDDEASLAAERIIKVIAASIETGGLRLSVGASAGIAIYPDHGTHADELMRKADVALYRAKRDKRGAIRRFEVFMDNELHDGGQAEAELKEAIAGGQIVPFFQPVVNLATGRIEGFEVLARWQHPEKGILGPQSFISVAEDFGLIDELSISILRQACETARTWLYDVRIAVNISPAQLDRLSFAERFVAVAAESDFPLSGLEIEVTETTLYSDLDQAVKVVSFLKKSGVQVTLDDFGIGYSSLHHLRALPFDRVKIDGSFVKSMTTSTDAAAIVNAILALGRSLDIPVVAEWVENAETALALKGAGCAAGQGWYFGEPMPALMAWQLLHEGPKKGKWSAVA